MSPATMGDYLRRAKVAGLSWPLSELFDDARLEHGLFPVPPPPSPGAAAAGLALPAVCLSARLTDSPQDHYPPPT